MTKKRYFFVEGWESPKTLPTRIKEGRMMVALPPRSYGVDEDIARLFAKKRLKKKLTGGSTVYKSDSSVKASRIFNVPKTFIKRYIKNPPKKKEDFIDRLIAYEGGETTPQQDIKFLEEVDRKGLTGSLQGHYGRAVARMKTLKKRIREPNAENYFQDNWN